MWTPMYLGCPLVYKSPKCILKPSVNSEPGIHSIMRNCVKKNPKHWVTQTMGLTSHKRAKLLPQWQARLAVGGCRAFLQDLYTIIILCGHLQNEVLLVMIIQYTLYIYIIQQHATCKMEWQTVTPHLQNHSHIFITTGVLKWKHLLAYQWLHLHVH